MNVKRLKEIINGLPEDVNDFNVMVHSIEEGQSPLDDCIDVDYRNKEIIIFAL